MVVSSHLAAIAFKTIFALAHKFIHAVKALSVVAARHFFRYFAFIDIDLAVCTCEPRLALTGIFVNAVNALALSAILIFAVVDIDLNINPTIQSA